MPDISKSIIARDCHRHFYSVMSYESIGYSQDICGNAGANIKGVTGNTGHCQPKHSSVGDIIDEDKVARLTAVFENVYTVAILNPGRKNGEDTGVRIAERLSRTIYILIAERDRLNTDRLADHMHQLTPYTEPG